MAKQASAMAKTKSGKSVRVYAAVTPDGTQVQLWSALTGYGFWNIDRLEGGTLTARSLRILLGEERA